MLVTPPKKKQAMDHEGDSDANGNWGSRNNHQRIDKVTEKLGNNAI